MELFKRNIIHDELQTSLDIVRKFIIDKGLILTGGMAIDLSLKMNNKDGIYDKNTVPDYDCVSQNHYKDACELAKILCKNFSFRKKNEIEINVGVIPAMHVQSCRVRVNFEVVADITYVPSNLYENIPFLVVPDGYDEAGMKIIHPLYQMIDQHHAISNPIENFPREVIFNRLKKDIKRFDLLYNLFLLSPLNIDSEVEIENNNKNKNDLIDKVIDFDKELSMILNIIQDDYKLFNISAYNYILKTNENYNCFEILTDSYEKVKSYLKQHKIEYSEYNRSLDIIPMYLEFTNDNKIYKIYNNLNSKVCILDEKCVHPQNILMTLLFNYHFNHPFNLTATQKTDNNQIEYIKLYKNLISYIQKTDSKLLLPLFDFETPLLYGKYNKTDSYIFQNYELRKKLNIEQTEETEKYISYENVRVKPFYPSKDKKCESLYENSEMTDENLNRMLLLPEYNRNSKKIE